MTSQKKKAHRREVVNVQGETEIPEYMRNNGHITSGFRVGHSVKELLASLFGWHNETVNVWTHLLPALLIFAFLLSSNLFTEHYTDRQTIADFSDKLKVESHTISGEGNFTYSSELTLQEYRKELLDQLVGSSLTPISNVRQQVQDLLKLTVEDQLPIKDKITNRLSKLNVLRDALERVAMMVSDEQNNLTLAQLKSYRSTVVQSRQKIVLYLDDIISAVVKLSTQVNPIPKWPILIFVISATLCLSFSCTFHLLYPFSSTAYKILRKLDYAGVVLLIVGSSVPPFIYGSQCHASFKIYEFFIVIAGLSVFGSLMSGYFDAKDRYKYKSYLFMAFGLSFLIPITHALILENFSGEHLDSFKLSEFVPQYLLLGAVYLLGLMIYTMRCPERYVPGHFDHCGASHQIWHVLVVIGLVITYKVTWEIYYKRRLCSCL